MGGDGEHYVERLSWRIDELLSEKTGGDHSKVTNE